jgi:putative endonuclease
VQSADDTIRMVGRQTLNNMSSSESGADAAVPKHEREGEERALREQLERLALDDELGQGQVVREGLNRLPEVYILGCESDPTRHYVGRATKVDERLEWHNAGPCGYTIRHRPWRLIVSIEFPDEPTAAGFEKYLKTGSGRAFAKRHFAPREGPLSLRLCDERR